MQKRLKIYLAGPEVFLPDVFAVGARKKQLCADYGFEGLFPADQDGERDATPDDAPLDVRIFRSNLALMNACDLAILNLTPFRGPSADVGTVFELGLLFALGKPIYGYSNTSDDLLDRVARWRGASFDPDRQIWIDKDGLVIENFGNGDNLMIDAALLERGFRLVRHATPADAILYDLRGFEDCLKRAAAHFGISGPGSVPGMLSES